jgi:hypothetical protein
MHFKSLFKESVGIKCSAMVRAEKINYYYTNNNISFGITFKQYVSLKFYMHEDKMNIMYCMNYNVTQAKIYVQHMPIHMQIICAHFFFEFSPDIKFIDDYHTFLYTTFRNSQLT